MYKRIVSFAFIAFFGILIINWSCTKLDTTTLGSDLVPPVDNINTFADTFNIVATQSDFTDTTIVTNADNQVLGNINNDPMFGKTTANLFLQVKPAFFPYAFANKDSLTGPGVGFDSVVLCISYKYFWGDSSLPQKLQAFEITSIPFADSVNKNWRHNEEPITGAAISDPKVIDVRRLADYMKYKNFGDSVNNQIRIKITDPTFLTKIFSADSTSLASTGNHYFLNDSTFRRAFNGIAVKATGTGPENGLMYVNVTDTNTKLEVHYRKKGVGKIDTTYTSFKFYTTSITGNRNITTLANSIEHDRSGTPSLNPASPASDDIYLQTQPGTYATLHIPDLDTFSNNIIHRAELIIEQVPTDPHFDTIFSAPNFLYVDLKEPGTATPAKYKTIYSDLNQNVFYDPDYKLGYFYPTGGPDFLYYGGYLRRGINSTGQSIDFYNINITRYVQQLVTKRGINYDMRLFPAFRFHYPQYEPAYISYSNNVAYGRVRVGSGTNPNYKMRIRVVFSKIK